MDEAAFKHLQSDVYRRLFTAVRKRLELAGPGAAKMVTLSHLSAAECQAIANLHGWDTVPSPPIRISIERLDLALRSSRLGAGLAELLEAMTGPLRDIPSEKRSDSEREDQLWEEAKRHAALRPEQQDGSPTSSDNVQERLLAWLENLRAKGTLKRLASGSEMPDMPDMLDRNERALLLGTLDILIRISRHEKYGPGALQADSIITLPVLAAAALGDPHALDTNRPFATLVQGALVAIANWQTPPLAAADRRRLWAHFGVACDPLSCDVLVLGLRPSLPSQRPLARHLNELAEIGEPRRITLRELSLSPIEVPLGTEIFICENPGILTEAAEALGKVSPPMICTEGIPSSATLHLLDLFARCGAKFRVRADFDWNGIRIVGHLLTRYPGSSVWRFSEKDYRTGLELAPEGILPLAGSPAFSPWEPGLTDAMREANRPIFEEQLAGILVRDLGEYARSS